MPCLATVFIRSSGLIDQRIIVAPRRDPHRVRAPAPSHPASGSKHPREESCRFKQKLWRKLWLWELRSHFIMQPFSLWLLLIVEILTHLWMRACQTQNKFDIKGVQPRSRMCILCILCLMCRSRILRIYYADQILQWCCQEASFSSLHYVVGKSKTSQSKPFMKHRFVFISKPPSW